MDHVIIFQKNLNFIQVKRGERETDPFDIDGNRSPSESKYVLRYVHKSLQFDN